MPCCATLIHVAMFAAFSCLSGCMIPYPSHKVYEGKEIKAESLSWLHAGETPRALVIEKLGAPDVDFVDRSTIAYAWSGQSGAVLFIAPNFGAAGPIMTRRALLIRFNADNKVDTFSFISRQTEFIAYDVRVMSFDAKYDDWRTILEQWLAKQGQRSGQSGAERK